MLPTSALAASTTWNVHVPSAGDTVSEPSGLSGLQVPVNGAASSVTELNGVVAASSSTTWHMLLPPPPLRENTVAVVPSGATSVPTRSPTNVWSIPTVVDAASVLHAVPSMENVRFDA